jgi:hypothetical protein
MDKPNPEVYVLLGAFNEFVDGNLGVTGKDAVAVINE